MKYLFVLDTETCIGCGACAVACMDQNDIDLGNGDKPYRQCFAVEQNASPSTRITYLSMACMHCAQAPCIEGCPVGCLWKDEETGFTLYDNTNCIGCHSCAMACPFSAPCFNDNGKMTKCTGCVEQVERGMLPACVKVCPYGALQLVPEEEYSGASRAKKARLLTFAALNK